MQDYYKIQKYLSGGTMTKAAGKWLAKVLASELKNPNAKEAIGKKTIQAFVNSRAHTSAGKELKELMGKMLAAHEKGKYLDSKEASRLINLIQQNKGTSKKMLRFIPRGWNEKATEAAKTTTKAAETAISKPAEVAVAPEVTKKTLRDYWKTAKGWLNNNPKTTLAAVGLGLGTGPGRYILGNTLAATQSSPDTWFNNSSPSTDTLFIEINGQKVPIKQSEDGIFRVVSQEQAQEQPTDDIDALIKEVSSTDQLGLNQTTQETPSYQLSASDQEFIDQLFSEDQ